MAWYDEEPLAPGFAAVIRRYTAGYTSGHWHGGEAPRPGDVCVGTVANTGNFSYWFVRAEDAHLIPPDYRYVPQFTPQQSEAKRLRDAHPENYGSAPWDWQEPRPFRALTEAEEQLGALLDPARG